LYQFEKCFKKTVINQFLWYISDIFCDITSDSVIWTLVRFNELYSYCKMYF